MDTNESPVASAKPVAKAGVKTVKARVLVNCAYGKTNDVVFVSADVLKADDDADTGLHQLDAAPAAVAYAESLSSFQ